MIDIKLTIHCISCGKEKIIRADKEFQEELANAKHVLCQKRECQEAITLQTEDGFIRVQHFFGDFWSVTRKATVEEQQSVWRANKILHRAKKRFEKIVTNLRD